MSKLSDDEKNGLLKEVIFSLSKAQDVLEDSKNIEKYCIKLEKIYALNNEEQGFRHNYSDIFGWLSQIDKDISGESGNLDILAQNVEYIKNFYEGWKSHGIGNQFVHKQIGKLYDHINLDIARMNYIKAICNESESKMEGIHRQILDLEQQTEEEKEKADDVSKKVNNAYSEFVSILGIFSAIVMVFFGGASIFGNIFKAMKDVPVHKSIIVCAITGVMTADIIFLFLYFLSKLLGRSLAVDIPEWEYYSSRLKKFRVEYPAVFYFNAFGIIVMIVTGCIWGIKNIKIDCDNIVTIINSISIRTKLSQEKTTLLIGIIGIWVVLNTLFVVAYILAKIMDFNIGKNIQIKTPLFVYWSENDGEYTLYREDYPEDKALLKSKNIEIIKVIEKICKAIYSIRPKISNAITRVFKRYPYMAALNIVMPILFWCIFKNK